MSSKRKEFNLFENKQLVHIVSEVVVLIGLTFYFSSKNKKLMGHVEELAQRIEDQEDHIQKLENTVQQLSNAMTQAVQRIQSHEGGLSVLSERINSFGAEKQRKPVQQRHVKPILKEVKQPTRVTKIQFKRPEKVESDSDEDLETEQKQPDPRSVVSQPKTVEKKTDEEELSDSDLDDEISEELAELEEDDSSLKKEN